jgi:hypothetical protein
MPKKGHTEEQIVAALQGVGYMVRSVQSGTSKVEKLYDRVKDRSDVQASRSTLIRR